MSDLPKCEICGGTIIVRHVPEDDCIAELRRKLEVARQTLHWITNYPDGVSAQAASKALKEIGG